MLWVRVDNRLVHGQVIETWLPYSDANILGVVNDELAYDYLQQEIMKLAIPKGCKIFFTTVDNVLTTLNQFWEKKASKTVFILISSCQDAKRVFDQGLLFNYLNVGNIHYAPGKQRVCDHIALSQEDINCLSYLKNQGVKLDFRCVPSVEVQINDI